MFLSFFSSIFGLGEIRADCTLHSRLPDDIIVFPGQPGMAHMHDFFGAEAIYANATLTEMLNSVSSCDPFQYDHSAYWIPTLINDGRYVAPDRFTVYYHALGNFDKVETLPQELKVITRTSKWGCQGGTPIVNPLSTPIPSCGANKLEILLNFPDCWDGINLDSPDHMSHMAFSAAHVCPSTHPHLVPRVQYKISWPINGEGHVSLSSGSGATAHADFIMGFDPVAFQLRVNECLHANKKCPNSLPGDKNIPSKYQSNPVSLSPIPTIPRPMANSTMFQ